MNKIVDFQKKVDDKTNWETSKVICEHCVYPFVSTHPCLCELECPNCGEITKIDYDIFELFFTYLNNIKEMENRNAT